MSNTEFSKPQLERLHRVMSGYIERGEMPGLVALVSHEDEAYVETLGTLSFESTSLMKRDTIFRIASLTKLITAVAAMILVEDCKIRLDESIDAWLPELSGRRVLRQISSGVDDTVPALRAITLRDLLTYRMGFGSVMAAPGTYPIQQFVRDYQLGGDGPVLPTQAPGLDQWLQRLGSLPLLAQPGERWMYHTSGEVLGALVSRVSGQTLGDFMRQRIFEPLGMRDTGFHVPPEKLSRLAGFYFVEQGSGTLKFFDNPANSAWSTEPLFQSGGGGLVSTIDDYFTFCLMMLNKGQLGGERILCRLTVDLMTSDQITPDQRAGADIFFGANASWGLGMAVDIRRNEIYQTPGRFGWTGGFGLTGYVDPKERVTGLLFTQSMLNSPGQPKVFSDFWTLAYAALN